MSALVLAIRTITVDPFVLGIDRLRVRFMALDPRYIVASCLLLYLILGLTVLGFNRSPSQAAATTFTTCALEVLLCYAFNRKWIWPLSAFITSLSLSILLNYSHDYFILAIPVFYAIGSKYLFTFKGRHAYNPAQAAVSLSILFSSNLITAAPSYQWNGIASMGIFIAMLGVLLVMPKINRTPLVVSFLAVFTLLTALRAFIMRHHLPFQTLFFGTMSSPPFFLFTFFMITDPMTSPNDRREQIKTGALIAFLDLAYHLGLSYFTFFYAAFTLGTYRLLGNHVRAMLASPSRWLYLRGAFWDSGYYRRPLLLGALALVGVTAYKGVIYPELPIANLAWTFNSVPPSVSGIDASYGKVLDRVDPRIQHMAKWVMSITDGVAVGDVNGDGRPDLFFVNSLKRDEDRLALYLNRGDYRFERFELPEDARKRSANLERYGIPTNALFVDYDNDGALDIFITYAFGSPRLLRNTRLETGQLGFKDVTAEVGLEHYTNSVAATFLDVNRDGKLDLFIANVWPADLPDYDTPHPLNLFHLPLPEFPGDRRMFNFMHASWNNSDNGGMNELWLQGAHGRFVKQDSVKWGLPETRWSLAVGTADLNHDGWTDLYVANDFGPDDLYLNDHGQGFRNVKGDTFGSIGRDTYKGMNASIQDLTRTGDFSIYVSNVHHAMQAEGSLLWQVTPGADPFHPVVTDRATQMGALNEDRFGWGASLMDFDNDGWVDIAQANGMVNDNIDKRQSKCPDYWYVNEKIARSPPSIHRYIDAWGDIRGMCIYGDEKNRLYLNQGAARGNRFVDVAEQVALPGGGTSRGMAGVDLTGSGRLDLVTTHNFERPDLSRNDLKPGAKANHWIGFDLESLRADCNRGAIGSTVRVTYPGEDGKPITQMREAQVVDGFSAQNDRRLHFGLGSYAGPVEVQVTWCGTREERLSSVQTDAYRKLVLR